MCKRFTLIELLIVIVIIAILLSLLLPSLSRAKNKAKRVKCISQLKQIGVAGFTYIKDHQGTFPSPYWGVIKGRAWMGRSGNDNS